MHYSMVNKYGNTTWFLSKDGNGVGPRKMMVHWKHNEEDILEHIAKCTKDNESTMIDQGGPRRDHLLL